MGADVKLQNVAVQRTVAVDYAHDISTTEDLSMLIV
eukprot:CAMPEP_0181231174 /NCGR_PEP_ID=MMETSP1096-20121128/34936_1 /TAXON_ID=156174 ORGANISM="Chrysochromulina ericina, Strain CCMP281" /NCGR_SAMPLE_ID=MMETSP1096 /ASSEMBLY_ACC=CAM_ASM_000453 /LENGTH=35 /DNA_ID= /DNA_START= /DNA_END= /DNA_ORIENTATION=